MLPVPGPWLLLERGKLIISRRESGWPRSAHLPITFIHSSLPQDICAMGENPDPGLTCRLQALARQSQTGPPPTPYTHTWSSLSHVCTLTRLLTGKPPLTCGSVLAWRGGEPVSILSLALGTVLLKRERGLLTRHRLHPKALTQMGS